MSSRLLGAVLLAAAALASPVVLVAGAGAGDSSPCAMACASEYAMCGASCALVDCQSDCADAYWSCLKTTCPPAPKKDVAAESATVAAGGLECLPTCQAEYTNALSNCYIYAFMPVQLTACMVGAQQTLTTCSAACMMPGIPVVPGAAAAAVEAKKEVVAAAPVKAGGLNCLPDCQAAYANDYAGCTWNVGNPVMYTACVVSAGQQLTMCMSQCATSGMPGIPVVPGAKVAATSSKVASRLMRRLADTPAKECQLDFSYCVSGCESDLQACMSGGHNPPATCAEFYKECTTPLYKGDDSCMNKLVRCNEQSSAARRA